MSTNRGWTWEELEDENAMIVVGVISRLLKQLARQSEDPILAGLERDYRTEATAGDYENLMAVSHRYAREYLALTLQVPEVRA